MDTTKLWEEHSGLPFDLPDMLRLAREAAGMTQRELGEACGLCQATIYRLEKGKIDPRSEQLDRYLKPLGLRVVYQFEAKE